MLIFLIFVMLAAERRAEMGMARAIGTKRRNLIQQFLFEGYVYNLGAALVGIVLGVLVGLGMVKVMAFLLRSVDFTLQSHVEPRSLVVAFCLGALVTFLTVVVSSFRVSRLNIVAAIRDLPEDFGTTKTLGSSWQRSLNRLPRHPRRMIVRTVFTVIGLLVALALFAAVPGLSIVLLLVIAGFYFWPLLAALIARGPILLIAGVPLIAAGLNTKQVFFFSTGVSLILIGASMLLRWVLAATTLPDPIRNRICYTLAGLTLVIYWLLPFDFLQQFGVPKLDGGIEMFFVSGVMLVIGGVWTVMYNADLIANGLMRLFGRQGSLAPILKMAVTYPMQHKVRTGLTLAMFSLVIFTLMVMSVLTGSTSGSLKLDRDTGGYQIYGAVSQPGATASNASAIAANPQLSRAIAASGGIGKVNIGVRQPGQQDQSWQQYNANVLDDNYLAGTRFIMHSVATGFGSSAAVWQTLRSKPGYAVVDSSLVSGSNGGGFGNNFSISGFKYADKTFKSVRIEVRDNRTGTVIPLTVIGVLDQNAANLPELTTGIYTGENSFTAAGAPAVKPSTYVYRVTPGADVHATALLLGKTFLHEGLDVKEAQKEFNTNQAIGIGLNYLLQGFMGLGLIVGIAALGVIAFRSVVERRQHIGMMRAIGFQKSMVRSSFLLESSFVAILGTLLGVVLGLVLAKNLVDSIAKNDSSVVLTIPWLQIGLIVVIAYIASLITTYLPAWQASRVYPAEALRYE
jgi:putative ABC transport system permease protein